LGEVNGYTIYFADYSLSTNGELWSKDGYTFPLRAKIQIVGIRDNEIETFGNLLFEKNISTQKLYELIKNVNSN
jgi:hypothetical protein